MTVPGAGTGTNAAESERGPTHGSWTLIKHRRASLQGAETRQRGKAAVEIGRMEREPNHKPQPRVAFSVVSMPGDPQSLMKTGSLQTMEMLLQFLHRRIWEFSPNTPTAPRQGSEAHSALFSSEL